MNRNKTLLSYKTSEKKWMAPTALALAAIMGVSTGITTPVYASGATVSPSFVSVTGTGKDTGSSENDKITKEETVYVVADSKGKTKTITVSDKLKGAGKESTVSDVSELKDIENTNGDETFEGSNDDMTWHTAGDDIYYQGKSDKSLPVGVSFTYYLDGEEIEPEDLVGKSGKLTIDIEYENNTETTVNVDGRDQTTKIPFVMMTGLIMPSDKFSDITIHNGKIIDDGSKSIVVGFGMPGLSDILDVDRLKDSEENSLDFDDIKDKVDNQSIPESVEIKADVKDFELDSTYTVAINDVFNEIDFSDVSSLSDLTSKVSELEDATLKIVDGSKELSDGTKTLKDNYVKLDSGIAELQNGIKSYTDGVNTASGGASELYNGAVSLRDGLGALSANSAALSKGASDASDGVKAYVSGVEQIKSGINTKQEVLSNNSPVDVANNFLQTNEAYQKLGTYSALLQSDKTAQVLTDIKTAMAAQAAATQGQAAATQQDQENNENKDQNNSAKANNISIDTESDNESGEVTLDKAYSEAPETIIQIATDNNDAVVEENQNDAINEVQNEIQNGETDPDSEIEEVQSIANVNNVAKQNVQPNQQDQQAQMQTMIASIVAKDYGLTDQATIVAMTQIIGAGLQAYQTAAAQGQDAAMAAFSSAATTALYTAAGVTDANGASATIQEAAMAQALVQLNSGLNTLTSNDSALISGADTLSASVKKYTDGVDQAYEGSKILEDGANTLNTGMQTIVTNNDSLNSGAATLKSSSSKVLDGINKLFNGASELSKGTKQYYDEVILNGLKPLSNSINKLEDITEGDYSYDNYSGISDDMDGSVKFIITTESIKSDD